MDSLALHPFDSNSKPDFARVVWNAQALYLGYE
jgi:hypothetical protein